MVQNHYSPKNTVILPLGFISEINRGLSGTGLCSFSIATRMTQLAQEDGLNVSFKETSISGLLIGDRQIVSEREIEYLLRVINNPLAEEIYRRPQRIGALARRVNYSGPRETEGNLAYCCRIVSHGRCHSKSLSE